MSAEYDDKSDAGRRAQARATRDADPASDEASERVGQQRSSLIESLLRRAGKVAGGTLDKAMDVATLSAVFGDSWLRDLVSSGASPERLEAMAEAGHFLRDARETAGLSLKELADRLELKDDVVLEGVERGEAILPLEVMLRSASLLARHDPIPFLLKFLRSYNPQLEATLEQWGVMALPRNFERERRFINLYRQHDFLRDLGDEEHQRFIDYMDASTKLVVEVMQREAAAPRPAAARASRRRQATARAAGAVSAAASPGAARHSQVSTPVSKRAVKSPETPRKTTTKTKAKAETRSANKRPVVRKVKPRSNEQ